MNDPNAVEFTGINFSYHSEKALDNITFTVKKGDFVGIIGPNGSGKTTLLRVILNLLTPQSGQVKLFGQPQAQFRQWSRIGYVPQKVTQFETKFPITVDEVISLGRVSRLGLFGRLVQKDKRAVSHALYEVDIENLKHKLITELSGGQQQRVFIAKALASNPELLILDEPTTGVDTDSQEKFYDLLTKLNQEMGLTIILVSHDIGVVINEVKSLFCINKSLIFRGSPKEFVKGDNLNKLYGKEKRYFLHGH